MTLDRPMKLALWVATLGAFVLVQPTIAMGEEAAQVGEEAPKGPEISDGSALSFADLGMTISPPAGWEIVRNFPGMTLVMQPIDKEVKLNDDKTKTKFRRNITVVTRHEPVAIDPRTATEFSQQLTEMMKKDSLVANFQVLEHKFFDYRGKNDALMFYSAMNLGEFPMMQMHILISSGQHHFLLSYTDLAENFSKQDEGFAAAWASMTSINVQGEAPKRYENLIRYGAVGGVILLLLGYLGWRSGRSKSRDYADTANEIYNDDATWDQGNADMAITQSGVWMINGDGDLQQSFVEDMTSAKVSSYG